MQWNSIGLGPYTSIVVKWFWNYWTITIEYILRVQPLFFEVFRAMVNHGFVGLQWFGCECVRFATAMHDNKYQGQLAVAKLPLLQKSIIKIENGNCDTNNYLFFLENIVNFNYLRRSLSSSLVIWWPLKIQILQKRSSLFDSFGSLSIAFNDSSKDYWSNDVMVLMDRIGLFYSLASLTSSKRWRMR